MSKLSKLISSWPKGAVYTSNHLKGLGYSAPLIAQYKKSGWVESLGRGAIKRKNDPLNWRGGLEAIQKQLKIDVHLGAQSALELYGITHYLRSEAPPLYLFSPARTRLPAWFEKTNWKQDIEHFSNSLFRSKTGVLQRVVEDFSLSISSRERALFEQLSLVPSRHSFRDTAHYFDGLDTLRHDLIQKLLEECSSIKVKRLFMVIAEHFNYPWVRKLDLLNIDFGSGNRAIEPGGETHQKYNITVDAG